MVNPRVFLDLQIGTLPAGRITIELFPEHAPKACANFLLLCRGTKPPVSLPPSNIPATIGALPTTTSASEPTTVNLSYKGSVFHRVVADFMLQGGDITRANGTGGLCALSLSEGVKSFEDENLGWREIDAPGLVCMANRGPGTNTSQFFITLDECRYLTEKHTLFGKVVSGMDVVQKVGEVPVDAGDRPLEDVIVVECGLLEFPGHKKGGSGKRRESDQEGKPERSSSRGRSRHHTDASAAQGRRAGGTALDGVGSSNAQKPTDADNTPLRGRSRTPVPTDPLSPAKTKSQSSPEHRHHRERDQHRHHDRRHHRHRRSRSPITRSRSPRHHHYHRRRDSYTRADDPEAEERIAREERAREGLRRYDDVLPAPVPAPPVEGEVKFKGRGTMRYRERKQWGQGDSYGRLN